VGLLAVVAAACLDTAMPAIVACNWAPAAAGRHGCYKAWVAGTQVVKCCCSELPLISSPLFRPSLTSGEGVPSFYQFELKPFTTHPVLSFSEVQCCGCTKYLEHCTCHSSTHGRSLGCFTCFCAHADLLQLSSRTAAVVPGRKPTHPYGRCFETAHLCIFRDGGLFVSLYGAQQVGAAARALWWYVSWSVLVQLLSFARSPNTLIRAKSETCTCHAHAGGV
jgi:hypothetical protein